MKTAKVGTDRQTYLCHNLVYQLIKIIKRNCLYLNFKNVNVKNTESGKIFLK